MSNVAPLTDLLHRAREGDETAMRRLFDAAYQDLRALARAHWAGAAAIRCSIRRRSSTNPISGLPKQDSYASRIATISSAMPRTSCALSSWISSASHRPSFTCCYVAVPLPAVEQLDYSRTHTNVGSFRAMSSIYGQQPIQRVVGRRAARDGQALTAEDRAAMLRQARYRTRVPKGIFIYDSSEEMEADRLRWTVDAMLEKRR